MNEGPAIAGLDTRRVSENFAGVLAAYTGEDPEDTTAGIIRWSLSGTDRGDFAINGSGELIFRYPPDYGGRRTPIVITNTW